MLKKKLLSTSIISCILIQSLGYNSLALENDYSDEEKIIISVEDESTRSLNKTIKEILKEDNILADEIKVNIVKNKNISIPDTYVITLDSNKSVNKVIESLSQNKDFEYVQKSHVFKAIGNSNYNSELIQNYSNEVVNNFAEDTFYRQSTIAVLDTGINYKLKDFEGKVRTDIDKDFVNNDDDAFDDHFHGTHVSGIISNVSDNHTNILPIKVLDSLGFGEDSDIALGIRYAVDNGAKVINLSLGSSVIEPIPVIEKELEYANKNGVTVIAASGNSSSNVLFYPANSKYVVSVGATDNKDNLATFSNYGKGLDLVAPGVDIASVISNGDIALLSGTSMAAPHVSAVAGIMYSVKPDITLTEVYNTLISTTKDLGSIGYDTRYGWGRLDITKAIDTVSSLDKSIVKPEKPLVYEVSDNSNKIIGKSKAWYYVIAKLGNTEIGSSLVNKYGSFSIPINYQKPGTILSLVATNEKGEISDTVNITVKDRTPPVVPTINTVNNKSTLISGKSEPHSTVYIYLDGKYLGRSITDAMGLYKYTTKYIKSDIEIKLLSVDKSGNKSKYAITKVRDVIPPLQPSVYTVKAYDKTVRGRAEAYSLLKVSIDKKIYLSNADKNGYFNVNIPGQIRSKKIYVNAIDKSGNISTTTIITVK